MSDTLPIELPGTNLDLLESLGTLMRKHQMRLRTAESCTGGLVAALCTERSGSSDWFDRGYVTYSNEAKTQDLGVPSGLIQTHGAVSVAVAEAMVRGLTQGASGFSGLAITGVAGPTGGSALKPVGTVCFGWSVAGTVWTETKHLPGDRAAVRSQAAHHALTVLNHALAKIGTGTS